MTEEKNTTRAKNKSAQAGNKVAEEFSKLLDKDAIKIPQVGEIVKGKVLAASKSEVRLDINGIMIGVVRGPELYDEAEEYANLKPEDIVEATVIDEENENGELELSFRFAGQEKAWSTLKDAFTNKKVIKIKIIDANKGGLLARYCQIQGFLPVSQLAPENYPRVSGGDKGKILEKLKSFVGQEFEVNVITLDEQEDKIIFSEKNLWSEKQKDTIAQYKIGTVVDGSITAVTNFGVFVSFGENMEGLIHISELAWQRIDNPSDLYKVGDKIKAEVISLEGSKIFLSAKKLIKDPWAEASKKYKSGQIVKGEILKVNPFGLFVKLDKEIHGLAHISQLGLAPGQKIDELFKAGTKVDFEIMSIEPKDHRLGLKFVSEEKGNKKVEKAEEGKEGEKGDSTKAQKHLASPQNTPLRQGSEEQAKTLEGGKKDDVKKGAQKSLKGTKVIIDKKDKPKKVKAEKKTVKAKKKAEKKDK